MSNDGFGIRVIEYLGSTTRELASLITQLELQLLLVMKLGQ
jgi:hypothetical protein